MHFDWNIDEINELKKKADAHGENKTIKRHLECLDLHLEKYKAYRSHELRKKVWETVEDEAMDSEVDVAEMSPTELARTLPIGISAISQKLKRLVEEGVIAVSL